MDAVRPLYRSSAQPVSLSDGGQDCVCALCDPYLCPCAMLRQATTRLGASCRDDLERTCAEYERDPAPILRHDPNISQTITTSLPAPSGLSYKDKAELYRIQTEEVWGRWLWLVAELVPHGERPASALC